MRYHRQTLLPQVGAAGQDRLRAATVLAIGCGALGTVAAEYLVRAGVGTIRLCDRDVVEETNLQRQTLFTEADARSGAAKAIAATRRLGEINRNVVIEPHIVDVGSNNIEELARGVDVIIDGTDNAQTRYLVNDLAVKLGRAWVYGGAVGVEGRVAAFAPPVTACLRCVFPEPPAVGELPSCDTAGVLGPVAGIVASLQAAAAIRWIVSGTVAEAMAVVDAWDGRLRSVSIKDAKRADCKTCGLRRFEFLDAPATATAVLCGRNTVQVRPPVTTTLDLETVARRLAAVGNVQRSEHFVRASADDFALTVFPDGRVMVHGTDSPERARSIVARYVGS